MKSTPTVNIEYRGIAISSGYNYQGFRVDGESITKEYPTLEKACEAIDNYLKGDFKRVAVFWLGYRDEIERGEATSVTDDGEVWVSKKEKKGWGSRTRQRGPVYIDTPENMELLNQINEIKLEMEDVARQYRDKMTPLFKAMASIGGKNKEE